MARLSILIQYKSDVPYDANLKGINPCDVTVDIQDTRIKNLQQAVDEIHCQCMLAARKFATASRGKDLDK